MSAPDRRAALRRAMRSAALLLLALLALAAQARASDDQGVAVGGAGATAEMSALVPAALAANDEDDAASYADRYASDPAGGVISVAPAPLDPSFLPNFNCRKFALIKTHKTGSTTLGSVLFRAAAQQGLRVHPGPHVDSDAEVPAEKRGAFDVVLQHNRRGCLAPGELPRLLAHYSALLGTDDFTVVTTVRHPVARFLSHFYFFAADELERATGKPADLAALVKERGYNNLTSCVFGVQQLEEAVALVNSSLFRRMFFIPVEYLHEGVAMLSRRCGWGSSGSGEGGGSDTAAAVEAALGGGAGGEAGGQESDASSSSSSSSSTALSATTAMTETATGTGSATSSPPPPPSLGGSGGSNAAVFLNVNENSGDRGGHVRPSLRMDHFARNDPSLLRNMAEINSVDLFLYGAALAQFRERLAADAPSSLAVAAHLRAAQQRLGARCQGASRDWNAAPSMCSWLALYDTIYLSTVDDRTGLVNWETVVSGRPLSRLRREAERDVALLLPPARPFFVVAGAAVVSPAAVSGASSSSGAAATGATAAASTAESALATPEAIEAWSEALLRAGAQRVYLAHATAAPAGAAAGSGGGAATLTTPSAPAPAATPLVLSPRTQARVGSGEVVVLELGTHGDGGGFAAPAAAASADATGASSPLPGAAEAAAYAALTAAMRRAASWGLVVGLDERVVLAPGVRGLPWALADAERESPLVAQACAPVLLATERADASALLGGGGGGGGGAAGDNLDVAPSHLRPSAARLSRGVRCAARLANVRALRPHLHAPVHEGRAQALCAPAPAFWGEGGLHGGGADGEAGSLTASSAASASSSSSAVGGNGGGGATTQAAVAALGAYVEGASSSSSSPGSSAAAAVAAAVPAADSAAAPPSSIARLYGPAANCVARPMFFGIATADALEQDAEVVAATGSSGDGGSTVAGERVAAAAAAAAADEATMRPSITRRR